MDLGVIFDGDDTLWWTEVLYDRARQSAGRLVGAAGLDAGAWEILERRIDVANVARFGLSPQRFPTSCVEALDELVSAVGREPEQGLREAVRRAGAGVFTTRAETVDGVVGVLAALLKLSRVGLLTKGDPEIQRRRIEQSGLADRFHDIAIVEEKSAQAFRAAAERLGLPVERCWSVGNSLGSDVLPAIAAGLRAVWVDAHVWEYERSKHVGDLPAGVIRASNLRDVPRLIVAADVPVQALS